MATVALDDLKQDDLAMAVAQAVAIANEAAAARGTDVSQRIVTVTEESPPPARLWRVHYGHRDYVKRRGGDLTVVVNEQTGSVERVLRGQ